MRLLGQRPRYQEGPPEGAGCAWQPPLGAWMSTELTTLPIGRPRPLRSHSPTAVANRNTRRVHAGSLEALRVARPEAVVS
jgi:hypothetical protein